MEGAGPSGAGVGPPGASGMDASADTDMGSANMAATAPRPPAPPVLGVAVVQPAGVATVAPANGTHKRPAASIRAFFIPLGSTGAPTKRPRVAPPATPTKPATSNNSGPSAAAPMPEVQEAAEVAVPDSSCKDVIVVAAPPDAPPAPAAARGMPAPAEVSDTESTGHTSGPEAAAELAAAAPPPAGPAEGDLDPAAATPERRYPRRQRTPRVVVSPLSESDFFTPVSKRKRKRTAGPASPSADKKAAGKKRARATKPKTGAGATADIFLSKDERRLKKERLKLEQSKEELKRRLELARQWDQQVKSDWGSKEAAPMKLVSESKSSARFSSLEAHAAEAPYPSSLNAHVRAHGPAAESSPAGSLAALKRRSRPEANSRPALPCGHPLSGVPLRAAIAASTQAHAPRPSTAQTVLVVEDDDGMDSTSLPGGGRPHLPLPERLAASQQLYASHYVTAPTLDEGALWTAKYRPRCTTAFLGNVMAVRKLRTWCEDWKARTQRSGGLSTAKTASRTAKRSNSNSKRRSSANMDDDLDDFVVPDEYFDDEGDYEEPLNHALLLTGPCGCGKSAAIEVCAATLGFKVLAISLDNVRSGRQILSLFREATQSHQVGKTASPDSEETSTGSEPPPSNGIGAPLKGKAGRKKASSTTSTKRGSATTGSNNKKSSKSKGKIKQAGRKRKEQPAADPEDNPTDVMITASTPSSSASSQDAGAPSGGSISLASTTVIVIEDIDHMQGDEKSIWSAINTILRQTKRPVIMTSRLKDVKVNLTCSYERVVFRLPAADQLVVHGELLCLAEGFASLCQDDLHCAVVICNQDIRRFFTTLQWFVRSGQSPSSSPRGRLADFAKGLHTPALRDVEDTAHMDQSVSSAQTDTCETILHCEDIGVEVLDFLRPSWAVGLRTWAHTPGIPAPEAAARSLAALVAIEGADETSSCLTLLEECPMISAWIKNHMFTTGSGGATSAAVSLQASMSEERLAAATRRKAAMLAPAGVPSAATPTLAESEATPARSLGGSAGDGDEGLEDALSSVRRSLQTPTINDDLGIAIFPQPPPLPPPPPQRSESGTGPTDATAAAGVEPADGLPPSQLAEHLDFVPSCEVRQWPLHSPEDVCTHNYNVWHRIVRRDISDHARLRPTALSLDYLPMYRTVCLHESVREEANASRRFTHYLGKNLINRKDFATLAHAIGSAPQAQSQLLGVSRPC